MFKPIYVYCGPDEGTIKLLKEALAQQHYEVVEEPDAVDHQLLPSLNKPYYRTLNKSKKVW